MGRKAQVQKSLIQLLVSGPPTGAVRKVQGLKLITGRQVPSKCLWKIMWAVGFIYVGNGLNGMKGICSDDSDG